MLEGEGGTGRDGQADDKFDIFSLRHWGYNQKVERYRTQLRLRRFQNIPELKADRLRP